MLRVRFAPSPTGFLHIGSARTFIFNWLYARHNGGTMILRIDDTDVGRNTEASSNSIFEGLRWLDLGWDEEYKQSDRLALHRQMAEAIFEKGLAYRDFTPADRRRRRRVGRAGHLAVQSRDAGHARARRATAAPPRASRSCCASACRANRRRSVRFADGVYGEQAKATADIEDFALLRSDGMPTYHLASCADDADLRISHIIRGQDHLTNTFKHVLIFEAAGVRAATFAHLPLLMAPDGTKLSKRRHGPVVSVTTYRDAGFLPQAFINFLCLLGWSPKNDREQMSAPGTGRRVFAGRHQPHQRRRQFQRGRSVRSQGRLAECASTSARMPAEELARAPAAVCVGGGPAERMLRDHAAHPRTHEACCATW